MHRRLDVLNQLVTCVSDRNPAPHILDTRNQRFFHTLKVRRAVGRAVLEWLLLQLCGASCWRTRMNRRGGSAVRKPRVRAVALAAAIGILACLPDRRDGRFRPQCLDEALVRRSIGHRLVTGVVTGR
jgi:hypothetical protein